MRVRRANLGDVPALMNLERQSSTTHWSQQQYEGLFAANSNRQRFTWIIEGDSESPEKASNEVPEILAFLVARKLDAEWELENIVVAETARRQGVGTRLLGELVAHARTEHGSGIFLEVRESNHSARALYRRVGFEETGLRKSYYANPPEDAILCSLSL